MGMACRALDDSLAQQASGEALFHVFQLYGPACGGSGFQPKRVVNARARTRRDDTSPLGQSKITLR